MFDVRPKERTSVYIGFYVLEYHRTSDIQHRTSNPAIPKKKNLPINREGPNQKPLTIKPYPMKIHGQFRYLDQISKTFEDFFLI